MFGFRRDFLENVEEMLYRGRGNGGSLSRSLKEHIVCSILDSLPKCCAKVNLKLRTVMFGSHT